MYPGKAWVKVTIAHRHAITTPTGSHLKLPKRLQSQLQVHERIENFLPWKSYVAGTRRMWGWKDDDVPVQLRFGEF